MPRIIFIEPRAPNLHIFSQFYSPRLGIFILGALARRHGWEADVIVEEWEKIDFSLLSQADLVGISTITSTAPRTYAIADHCRQLGIPVILGGPHVTFLTGEALEHADFVIRGEGEGPLEAFLENWAGAREWATVPGLSFKKEGRIVHNPAPPLASELDRLPFPDFSLLRGAGRRIGGRHIVPVQTSRGCPFDCSFCSVTGMFGHQYRFRSTASIIEELRPYNQRKNFIFFYDDNFTANREHTKELLRAMIRERFVFKWSAQVRTDVASDLELVRLMKKSGCHTVFIGFESLNPESLKAMKKKQTVADIGRAVKVLRRKRIHIHGMFVFGFDQDDWKTVKKTVRFARRARLTSSQFMILTPLPGSEFYQRVQSEKRLTFGDWTLFDAHHVVFRPARLAPFDLQKAQIFAHRKFYSLKQQVRELIQGRWIALAIARYARRLNRVWQKRNRTFLAAVRLLSPRPNERARVTLDYREEIVLDERADKPHPQSRNAPAPKLHI